jgi:hypothetical protein
MRINRRFRKMGQLAFWVLLSVAFAVWFTFVYPHG